MRIAISTTVTLVMAVAHGAVAAQTLEGVWRGRIEDRARKPVEFELQMGPAGAAPAGRLQPLDRGMVTPHIVDAAALSKEGEVRIDIQPLRVVIEGRLAPGGQAISGTWTQFGSDRQPARLTRVPSAAPPAFFDPLVEIRIPKAPTAVRTDGSYRLYYEIHVANFTEGPVELKSVDIQIGERTATLAGDALARQGISHGVSIPPAKSGGALMALGMQAPPPDVLRHRITFVSAGRTSTLETQAIPVGRNPPRISPPLRGGDWSAGNGPDSSLHHRAAIIPMDGRFALAQRFAFDFAKRVPGSSEFERGDPRRLESSPTYGAEVLAVADATVSMARDTLADTLPYEIASPHPITKETVGGNLVVLDLGEGHWAVYAHLQPGSVRVKRGDRVRRGDAIARVGNSASPSPHLHFHIVDGPEPFSSEGVPFVFDEFTHEGRVHRDEMPAGGWTIRFAEGAERRP